MIYDFGIFGGDMRQVYMGNLLEKAGYRVLRYGICKEEGKVGEDVASSFFELLEKARTWLGPIPLTRDQKNICQQARKEDLRLEHLRHGLQKGGALIAGNIPADWSEKGWKVFDYMKDEILTSFNSIATAEGAIAMAVTGSGGNLRGSRCLITGYGVCARTLASCLDGLKARVTVCARRAEARAEACTAGYDALSFEEWEPYLEQFDYIFNTVPALIFGREELSRVRKDALILDLASAPGGIDYEWADGLGIYAKLCPGIPGLYAPKASAQAMMEMVLRRMGQEEAAKEEPELHAANIRESD